MPKLRRAAAHGRSAPANHARDGACTATALASRGCAQRRGQEQEPGVVGEQMQPVKLHRVVPANSAVARRALQRRCREHHQRQPLAAMMSDIAHRLAYPRQRTEVVVRVHQLPKSSLLVEAPMNLRNAQSYG